METKRKIQLAAGIVIANSLLALGSTFSTPALADACPPVRFCGGPANDQCPVHVASACANASPGCTVATATCSGTLCAGSFPLAFVFVDCTYQ